MISQAIIFTHFVGATQRNWSICSGYDNNSRSREINFVLMMHLFEIF